MKKTIESFGSKDDREFVLKVKQFYLEWLKTLISALGLGATIFAGVGLYLTYQTSQEQQRLAQEEKQLNNERLITDRFSKAVEQLGSKDIAVRIGGIYALERIAKDSPKDHWNVMEVLTAYIRERSFLSGESMPKALEKRTRAFYSRLHKPAADVQSALTVIGRRDVIRDDKDSSLDMSNSNLKYVRLIATSFREARFAESDLRGANFALSDLRNAYFFGADLSGVNFSKADLRGADFTDAKLRYTRPNEYVGTNSKSRAAILYQGESVLLEPFLGSGLTDAQLESANLCRTILPEGSELNPNRDCKKLGHSAP